MCQKQKQTAVVERQGGVRVNTCVSELVVFTFLSGQKELDVSTSDTQVDPELRSGRRGFNGGGFDFGDIFGDFFRGGFGGSGKVKEERTKTGGS